jgi:hypothetical protein
MYWEEAREAGVRQSARMKLAISLFQKLASFQDRSSFFLQHIDEPRQDRLAVIRRNIKVTGARL